MKAEVLHKEAVRPVPALSGKKDRKGLQGHPDRRTVKAVKAAKDAPVSAARREGTETVPGREPAAMEEMAKDLAPVVLTGRKEKVAQNGVRAEVQTPTAMISTENTAVRTTAGMPGRTVPAEAAGRILTEIKTNLPDPAARRSRRIPADSRRRHQ